MSRRGFVVGLSALSLALAGCGDDGKGSEGTFDGPLYVMSTMFFSADLSSRTEQLIFADSLDSSGKVDSQRTIELNGENSSLWPSYQTGEFFLADAGTGSVLKYELGADGKVSQTAKVSFAAYGVQSFYWTLVAMTSPTKAFLFDETTLQGFVWNPSEMTITTSVDLKSKFVTEESGKTFQVWRERTAVKVGDRYFAAYKYITSLSESRYLGRSGMLVFDTSNDTFTVVEQSQCPALDNSVVGPDGMIYVSTGVSGAAAYFVGQEGITPPCVTRFNPETLTFDANFSVDLQALTGGKPAGAVMAHDGGSPYIRVLNESLMPDGFDKTNIFQIVFLQFWETYRLDNLMNPTSATKVDTPPAGLLVTPVMVDGKTYVPDANIPGGKSWLVDISVDPPVRTIELPGWTYYAVRVQ